MDSIENRWSDKDANSLSEPELLLYRSRLLGSDLSITNFGGGNTSAKVTMSDPISDEATQVLWVKGSGGDLGSLQMDGFATAYLDKLLMLESRYRGLAYEDEMVDFLPHCTFNNNPRAASIDTPLHAFLPYAHIDHMHPDALIAIAAAKNSQAITQELFAGELGWLAWQRPGFDLGLRLRDLVRKQPELRGVVLAGHGLFTWGDSSKSCYETSLWAINHASAALAKNAASAAFGGPARALRTEDARSEILTHIIPAIRARISDVQSKVAQVNEQPAILEFVVSADLESRAALGTSCPDHFLRTKIRPMIVPPEAFVADSPAAIQALDTALQNYRQEYREYYDRNSDEASPPMRDANPVVFLLPGVGMVTFAANKATARIASEFYVNAVNVIREADRLDEYVGLDEKEAFAIEYWALEEAKLRRQTPARSLAGRVALVTGAAGAIGSAVAERLLREQAAVVLSDVDTASLETVAADLRQRYGTDNVHNVTMDVTSEDSVHRAFDDLVLRFGGIDILVANAGIASSSAFEDTPVETWEQNFDVLSKGYFLAAQGAYRLMQQHGSGSIIFVGSKNGIAAASAASAYAAAKASELHLARCLALEGAAHGIRVNSVNPDAVLSGSKIWDGDWRAARARDNGIDEEQLADHYRDRSLLKKEVLPEDVAEAVYYFASDASSKSTGNIINVDAGNAAAFPR